jgi:hypothetical protein
VGWDDGHGATLQPATQLLKIASSHCPLSPLQPLADTTGCARRHVLLRKILEKVVLAARCWRRGL